MRRAFSGSILVCALVLGVGAYAQDPREDIEGFEVEVSAEMQAFYDQEKLFQKGMTQCLEDIYTSPSKTHSEMLNNVDQLVETCLQEKGVTFYDNPAAKEADYYDYEISDVDYYKEKLQHSRGDGHAGADYQYIPPEDGYKNQAPVSKPNPDKLYVPSDRSSDGASDGPKPIFLNR